MTFITFAYLVSACGMLATLLVVYAYRKEIFGAWYSAGRNSAGDVHKSTYQRDPEARQVQMRSIGTESKGLPSEWLDVAELDAPKLSARHLGVVLSAGQNGLNRREILELLDDLLKTASPKDLKLFMAYRDHVLLMQDLEQSMIRMAEKEPSLKPAVANAVRGAIEQALLREKRSIEGCERLLSP